VTVEGLTLVDRESPAAKGRFVLRIATLQTAKKPRIHFPFIDQRVS